MDRMTIRTDKRANQIIKLTGICRSFTFVLAILLLGGCVKDDLYNTPHPDKGAVRVTTDWSGASSDAVLPQSYMLRIGTQEQTASGTDNAFNTLFEPGRQDLLVYHQAEGITLTDHIATINTLADGTLNPMPGYLFSGAEELEIVRDDTLQVTVKMEQRIRNLTLALKLTPGDKERIVSTSATLTGIASAMDLRDGAITAAEGKAVVPTFAIATDNGRTRAEGQPILSATLRLPGAMPGEKQILTLAITLPDGYVHTITSDLTEALKNFGEADMEPLELDATLELPVEAGMDATITDWKEVDNGHIDIH